MQTDGPTWAISAYVVPIPDASEVRRMGFRHHVFGHMLDMGSYTELVDIGSGTVGVDLLLKSLAELPCGVELRLVEEPQSETLRELRRDWDAELAAGRAVCVVVADAQDELLPLCIMCGYALPSMGAIPPAKLNDVLATLANLAKVSSPSGRNLLEELPSDLDLTLEQNLNERLRQLYGG